MEAFADHWGEGRETYEDFRHHHLDAPEYDAGLWFVAWDGNELAGYVGAQENSREDPSRGYIAVLGVRRPYRRRGLGEALLLHAFGALHARGRLGVDLHVDADSLTGATGLYAKVGMTAHPRFATWEKELRPGRAYMQAQIGACGGTLAEGRRGAEPTIFLGSLRRGALAVGEYGLLATAVRADQEGGTRHSSRSSFCSRRVSIAERVKSGRGVARRCEGRSLGALDLRRPSMTARRFSEVKGNWPRAGGNRPVSFPVVTSSWSVGKREMWR